MIIAAIILVSLLCIIVSLIARRIYKRTLSDVVTGKNEI
jgi:hypothetical protein